MFTTENFREYYFNSFYDRILQQGIIETDEFIKEHCQAAQKTFDSLLKETNNVFYASEIAQEQLTAYYQFSRFDMIETIVEEKFPEIMKQYKDEELKLLIGQLTIKCYPVFEKYNIGGYDYAYSDADDERLRKKIANILSKKVNKTKCKE